jgi:hypothetical protein
MNVRETACETRTELNSTGLSMVQYRDFANVAINFSVA